MPTPSRVGGSMLSKAWNKVGKPLLKTVFTIAAPIAVQAGIKKIGQMYTQYQNDKYDNALKAFHVQQIKDSETHPSAMHRTFKRPPNPHTNNQKEMARKSALTRQMEKSRGSLIERRQMRGSTSKK